MQFNYDGVMFMGSVLFGGKLHSCRRADMCMLWLISEDGKSIKLIKQALAFGNKSVTLKHFQKKSGSNSRGLGGWGLRWGVILVWEYEPVFWNQPQSLINIPFYRAA